jgi:signal transduction histidine kinase
MIVIMKFWRRAQSILFSNEDSAGQAGLEVGVLSVFRAFVWIWAGLTLGSILLGILIPGDRGLPPEFDLLNLEALIASRMLDLLTPLVLLLFLYLPGLATRLGKRFLPVGILLATLGPITSQNLFLTAVEQIDVSEVGGAWALLPILFAPLVLTAWQYRLKTVMFYALGSAVLDLALLFTLTSQAAPDLFPIIGAIVIRMVAMLISGYLIVLLMRVQRQQRDSLRAANVRLQGYLATQEQLTESRERNRLARELHDTLAHTLSMLSVQLEATRAVWHDDPAQSERLLDQSLEATRSGLTETRRALKALRASPLEDLGLLLALQELADDASRRGGLPISTSFPDRIGGLSPALEQTIYRTAQEGLANVVAHAQASQAELALRAEHDGYALIVSDNGIGLDPQDSQEQSHYGLQGLAERAELAGGTLTIAARPEGGTQLTLSVNRGAL